MRSLSSLFCISPVKRQDSGQALIWILLFLGISTLAIATILRVGLWKLDSTIALMRQRAIIESWELERASLIRNAYPTSSFKRISIENNQLAVPVSSKKIRSLDSLRIPVFQIGELNGQLLNWHAFLTGELGSCSRKNDKVCIEPNFQLGKTLFFGDLKVDGLELQTCLLQG